MVSSNTLIILVKSSIMETHVSNEMRMQMKTSWVRITYNSFHIELKSYTLRCSRGKMLSCLEMKPQ